MCEIIQKEINQIKKDLVRSLTMYSLSENSTDNNVALLDSVLLSWFKNVDTEEDFLEKYTSFKKLIKMENIFYLFNLVNIIEKTEEQKDNRIQVAMNLYNKIITNPEYIELSSKCGYELTTDFLDKEKYLDSTLYNNLKFLNLFNNELDTINEKVGGEERKVL